jgi:hypothetical protein
MNINETVSPNEDVFDPARLRLSQNFSDTVGVKKMLTTVPVRKPHRQDFVRVHPDPAWRLTTAVLDLKEERELYLVDRPMRSELAGEVVPTSLFTAMNRQGVLFLWPARLPREDGRQDSWSRTMLEAVQRATEQWVRVVANMSLGAYEMFVANADLPDPEWPVDVDFRKLLEIAFRDRFIRTPDHPLIKRLRGAL